jgi:hypothetical protein
VPTTKPRYTLTDTGELSEQLDRAQRRWPEAKSRKELLLRLVTAGSEIIDTETEDRLRAIRETAGLFTDVYEPGGLARLREDWPD